MNSHVSIRMYLSVFVFLLSVDNLMAQSAAIKCDTIKSTMDIVKCARENHPYVKSGSLSYKKSKSLEDIAKQRPNPEISADFISGKSLGDVVSEAEIRLSHVLETGGKRDARIRSAKSRIEIQKLNLEKAKSKVTLMTVVGLSRLKQVEVEIAALKEAEGTFRQIQRQYKKRGRLNPEAQVALNVFNIAENDYKLKRLGKREELRKLNEFFILATGMTSKQIDKYLPKLESHWPSLKRQASVDKGVDLKIAKSRIEQAYSEVDLAKSISWPDLTISPTYRNTVDGAVSYSSLGVGVSFPLPLFHVNGGGRDYAYENLTQSKIELKLKQKNIKLSRDRIVEDYKASVKAITKSVSYKSIKRKHDRLEKLFKRGVVSSAMVIESHRQLIEFLIHTNQHRLNAIEKLWTIYALDGNILGERI